MAASEGMAPVARERAWVLQQVGLGRRRQRLMELLAVVGVAGALVNGWGWNHAARLGADRIQRITVFVNPDTGVVLGQAPVGLLADPVLLDRAYLRVAMDWVEALRSRPQDADTFNKNMVKLAQLTDQRQYNKLGAELEQKRAAFGQALVEVTQMSANILDRGNDGTARVNVWWTQVKKTGVREESRHRATLKLLYRKDDTGLDFRKNVMGIYVLDATIVQEG